MRPDSETNPTDQRKGRRDADGSDGSGEAALSDIDVSDLLEAPEQAAEKEKLWLEMNQDWMEEQQRRQERNAVLAAVRCAGQAQDMGPHQGSGTGQGLGYGQDEGEG